MRNLIGFASGLVFGLGLTVSAMIDPAKVLAFLDVAGAWDPSLALVMAGAIPAAAMSYRLAMRREAPWHGDGFALPARTAVDPRLLAGSALFGVGWGLGGYCPGPAIAALAVGGPATWVFVAAMLAGMLLYRLLPAVSESPGSPSEGMRAG